MRGWLEGVVKCELLHFFYTQNSLYSYMSNTP